MVDEAYCEFVESPDFPDGMSLLEEYPNLVVFRTFSKMYGLAGLRIGYLAGSREVVDIITAYLRRLFGQQRWPRMPPWRPWTMTSISSAPATLVRAEKAYLTAELASMGLTTQSGEGCFVMVKLPMSDTLAYRRLMSSGCHDPQHDGVPISQLDTGEHRST